MNFIHECSAQLDHDGILRIAAGSKRSAFALTTPLLVSLPTQLDAVSIVELVATWQAVQDIKAKRTFNVVPIAGEPGAS